jgi:16S rRNA (guanine527-N7)-methyltransferase
MTELSDDRIEQLLRGYKYPVTREFGVQLRAYIHLFVKWNERISLTTVTDPVEIIKFHFGESLFAASAVALQESRLADVGTGAGFPGIPLAMAVPGIEVVLIESNSKKCVFLAEVLRELQLSNVSIFRGRMENFPLRSNSFDFVAARALGMHNELLEWSREHLSASGKLILWLGDADSAAIAAKSDWRWSDRILIPGSQGRFILSGSPIL